MAPRIPHNEENVYDIFKNTDEVPNVRLQNNHQERIIVFSSVIETELNIIDFILYLNLLIDALEYDTNEE